MPKKREDAMTSVNSTLINPKPQRKKFILGGILIAVAILYLIVSTTQSTSHYFYSVDELKSKGATAIGQNVRISGAVLGKSITYDPDSMELRFTIANVPGDQTEVNAQGGLAKVLHQAVADPNTARIDVIHYGRMPDLMRNEAQAIMDGYLTENGTFAADTLLLKCPTKYDDELPEQVAG